MCFLFGSHLRLWTPYARGVPSDVQQAGQRLQAYGQRLAQCLEAYWQRLAQRLEEYGPIWVISLAQRLEAC